MFALSRQDTTVMKGIAIIAMLFHHMYGAPPLDVVPYSGIDICTWQLPFVLGVVWKCYETKGVRIQEWLEKHKAIAILSSMCILCCMIILRMYPIIPHWNGIRMDGLLSYAIALCVITIIRNLKYTTDVLTFFGKHSMNIYMTHTFLNWYWCKEWLLAGEWLRGVICSFSQFYA